MPVVSKAQNRLMRAAAHSQAFAKKVHVPMRVAKEFVAASHGKSMAKLPERKKK